MIHFLVRTKKIKSLFSPKTQVPVSKFLCFSNTLPSTYHYKTSENDSLWELFETTIPTTNTFLINFNHYHPKLITKLTEIIESSKFSRRDYKDFLIFDEKNVELSNKLTKDLNVTYALSLIEKLKKDTVKKYISTPEVTTILDNTNIVPKLELNEIGDTFSLVEPIAGVQKQFIWPNFLQKVTNPLFSLFSTSNREETPQGQSSDLRNNLSLTELLTRETVDIESKPTEIEEITSTQEDNNLFNFQENMISTGNNIQDEGQNIDDEIEDDDTETKKKGSFLERFGVDLTQLARTKKLNECFGREDELIELMEILVRRQKNNPVLVGEAGVGKTAIVELFATRLVKNLVPFVLEGRRIISIDLGRIVAGARFRGEFELRFQKLLDEVLATPNIIIFIDEIHNITGSGSAEGSLDAANILKPVLSRSGFQCIGATTTKEYQRIEKDPALNRRFQPIKVKEPTIAETINILYGIRYNLESFHNVEITPAAIQTAAELADRHIYDRFLPDKAIDLLDRAAAKEVIKMTSFRSGSVLSSVVNAALLKIGALRLEAFRRGDIAVEFIFQEIENAYRNFLLTWLEAPLEIPKTENKGLSPLSQELFKSMRSVILTRVDDLLFSSDKPQISIKKSDKNESLSSSKNKEILTEFNFEQKSSVLSIYRISLVLFDSWIKNARTNKLKSNIKALISIFRTKNMKQYILHLRETVQLPFYNSEDFCIRDIEHLEERHNSLSLLELNKIEIFNKFLMQLKPILRKGLIESLQESGNVKLSSTELTTIYNLLGYFSTLEGQTHLNNLTDPSLLQRARKTSSLSSLKKRITPKEIKEMLAIMTGLPVQSLSNEESHKLANLETTLHTKVIGQEEAICAIAKAIRRSRLGIQNPKRPIASFLFCGPTGVGKTEVTKTLATVMFGSENDMIRFDMSEFMEKFSISRLIGSPPGYVGYEEGGQLTDAVRAKPYSVVLFDEIEKAHPDVLNILLQILEDGRLTDSQKRLVQFDNTIIIMTSNAAADEIQKIIKKQQTLANSITKPDSDLLIKKNDERQYMDSYAGAIKFLDAPIKENFLADIRQQLNLEFEKSFRALKDYEFLDTIYNKKKGLEKNPSQPESTSLLKDAVLEKLSKIFLPEFLNRLDDIIIFHPLKEEELRKICDIMIQEISERVKLKGITLQVDQGVKLKLSRDGYNPLFGARPLRRLVTKHIEDLISEALLKLSPHQISHSILRIRLNEQDKIIIVSN